MVLTNPCPLRSKPHFQVCLDSFLSLSRTVALVSSIKRLVSLSLSLCLRDSRNNYPDLFLIVKTDEIKPDLRLSLELTNF